MKIIKYIYDSLKQLVEMFVGMILFLIIIAVFFSILGIAILVVEYSGWYVLLIIPYAVVVKFASDSFDIF